MGKQYDTLTDKHIEFITAQKMFFVGTAAETGRVNVSPKGMDSLRIADNKRVLWLNATGSGNETSAHVQQNNRMTVMFCAFNGPPIILRLYGSAKVIHQNDAEWTNLFALFTLLPGARQIFDLSIEMVQTSCGMGVPYYDYSSDRELLNDWARKRSEEELKQYWLDKNQLSIDAIPTHIAAKNT
jgi:hypothetical protein